MSKPKIESASIRIYLQEGDRYLAIASIDRALPAPGPDGAPVPRPKAETFTGSSETSLGAALSSVLQLSGMLEP